MNCEQKKQALAVAMERRVIERRTKAEKETKFPTRFAVMKTPEGIVCKWSRNLSDKERAECVIDFITVRPDGYSAEEWDCLVRKFFKYLPD